MNTGGRVSIGQRVIPRRDIGSRDGEVHRLVACNRRGCRRGDGDRRGPYFGAGCGTDGQSDSRCAVAGDAKELDLGELKKIVIPLNCPLRPDSRRRGNHAKSGEGLAGQKDVAVSRRIAVDL